ncbi:hypothetical protein PR202_gb18546 [Eleusine coracana subsp. coracana]|uniref:Large ribosomal subunit protein uL11m n=1 Tax=Eleusine coracana subsp. coracana TaxID=191504 RepID=A0AAV5F7F3_ELECO|nr:hypothetical protein PR202_gb18546 [Eleusine coracana subsp. coracana]
MQGNGIFLALLVTKDEFNAALFGAGIVLALIGVRSWFIKKMDARCDAKAEALMMEAARRRRSDEEPVVSRGGSTTRAGGVSSACRATKSLQQEDDVHVIDIPRRRANGKRDGARRTRASSEKEKEDELAAFGHCACATSSCRFGGGGGGTSGANTVAKAVDTTKFIGTTVEPPRILPANDKVGATSGANTVAKFIGTTVESSRILPANDKRLQCRLLTAYKDSTFEVVVKSPSVSCFLREEAAGIETASSRPGHNMVSSLTLRHVYEIAKLKQADPFCKHMSLEALSKSIIGTTNSMGIEIVKDL